MEIVFNIDSAEDFRIVVEDVITNLYNGQSNINNILNDTLISAAKNDLQKIIFTNHCNSEQIHTILLSKGINKERAEIFSSIIQKKQTDLMYSMLLNYNSLHGSTIAMFDWTVKLIYGISELKKLKYPLMQLEFATLHKGKCEKKMYDVNKQMLTKMINVLETIQPT